MTGFDDTSEIDQLFNDLTFQAELDEACKAAFKRFSDPPYDRWEELRSEVFILLRESRTFFLQYRELTNEKGFLYRIALNRLISQYRRQRQERRTINLESLEALAGDLTAEKTDFGIFIKELFKEVIPLLKPNEQSVIEAWMDGKSFAAMARESKVARATISKRFANAIKKIQQYLMRRSHVRRKT